MSPLTTPSTPSKSSPWISAVITTYSLGRYADFRECVDSVLAQEYDCFDVVLVTETNGVRRAVDRDYGDDERVTIHHLDDGQNLATARNAGARAATGEVVAFIDDDAVAHEEWLAELARGYVESNLDAVGGSAAPDWLTDPVWYLPEEFYFLVGATHRGFADGEGEVRNTFGCNISFNREAFLSLGGFNTDLGKDHGHNLQSEETELCARLRDETGSGVYYVPTARIDHKVYHEQTSARWLLDRAYWQGVSKAAVDESADDATEEEWGFLGYLLVSAMPGYLRRGVTAPKELARLFALLVFTAAVGMGFLRGKLRV